MYVHHAHEWCLQRCEVQIWQKISWNRTYRWLLTTTLVLGSRPDPLQQQKVLQLLSYLAGLPHFVPLKLLLGLLLK